MRILIANLKLLHQCRKLWLVYPVLTGIMLIWWLMGIFDISQSLGLGMCLFINLPAGFIVGIVTTETLVKPFTYCLPAHRDVPRRVIFLVGIGANLLVSWLAIGRHGLSIWDAPGRMTGLFAAGLVAYLLGVLIPQAWTKKERWGSVCIIAVPTVVYGRWPDAAHSLLVRMPGVFAIVGLIVSAIVWWQLRGDARARVLCGLPIYGLADSSKLHKLKVKRIQQMQYTQQEGDALASSVESLFLERMKSAPVSSAARHAWGSLYLAFGPILARWKVALFSNLLITAILAYQARPQDMDLSDSSGLWMVGPVLCFLTILLPVPIRSSMLLPVGRRERFFSALAVVGASAMLILAVLLFAVTFASVLHGVAPAFFGRLEGGGSLVLPFALVPALVVLNVLVNSFVLQYTIFMALVGTVFGLEMGTGLVTVRFLLVASVCVWAVFILLTHRICMKRCLVA